MKKPFRLNILAAAVALAYLPAAQANPQGANVVAGNVAIQQESATKLGVTQTSAKAIVDWKSFSIGANEHTQFYQPSASSVILNRVVGEDPSQILGRLTANGQVFLVNPNGVFFGKNAVVDVAGLVATTHNIRNEDFLAGRYNFNLPGKPGAAVINEGLIRVADTGIAAFVAPSVANRGVIAARLGKVELAAANGFTLDFTGDQLVSFLVNDDVAQTAFDLNGQPLTSFVENSGRIEAQGGYVLLTAKAAENAIHSVINQSGVVEATSVGAQNGEIVLAGGQHGVVANTGILDASGKGEGETGGTVKITGEKIGLFAGTRIDVSGDQGGGKAIVGGDYLGGKASDALMAQLGIQRESEAIQTATETRMAEDAVIAADALRSGKGGKVVLWADERTQANGIISAKGGGKSGDGGFVETSGGVLDIAGLRVDASARKGHSGTWLLDPYDLWIDATAASSIGTTLDGGTNVTIEATNQIDIDANIVKVSGGDATFVVNGTFIYQHEATGIVSTAGKLNVDFEATDRVWIGRGYVGGESTFSSNGGNITFHGPNFVGVNGTIDAGTGNILVKAENKDSTGIDKGIWIFGTTLLAGNRVDLVTGDTLREDAGTTKIITDPCQLAPVTCASLVIPTPSAQPDDSAEPREPGPNNPANNPANNPEKSPADEFAQKFGVDKATADAIAIGIGVVIDDMQHLAGASNKEFVTTYLGGFASWIKGMSALEAKAYWAKIAAEYAERYGAAGAISDVGNPFKIALDLAFFAEKEWIDDKLKEQYGELSPAYGRMKVMLGLEFAAIKTAISGVTEGVIGAEVTAAVELGSYTVDMVKSSIDLLGKASQYNNSTQYAEGNQIAQLAMSMKLGIVSTSDIASQKDSIVSALIQSSVGANEDTIRQVVDMLVDGERARLADPTNTEGAKALLGDISTAMDLGKSSDSLNVLNANSMIVSNLLNGLLDYNALHNF